MKKTILICDDEEGIRESLKLILEKDYNLIFTANGNEAIEAIKKDAVDAVIMDIKMPRLDGIEAMRKIKELKPAVKILTISGYKSVDTAREAVNAGASDYIVKPFDRNEISKTVQKLLQ